MGTEKGKSPVLFGLPSGRSPCLGSILVSAVSIPVGAPRKEEETERICEEGG